MSHFHEIVCYHVAAIVAVGVHRIDIVAAVIEINKQQRNSKLAEAVDETAANLPDHDYRIDLIVVSHVREGSLQFAFPLYAFKNRAYIKLRELIRIFLR